MANSQRGAVNKTTNEAAEIRFLKKIVKPKHQLSKQPQKGQNVEKHMNSPNFPLGVAHHFFAKVLNKLQMESRLFMGCDVEL